MKKLSTLLTLIFFSIPFIGFGQGIQKVSSDPDVAEMEGNRKTDAPFSIRFKETAPFKEPDAQLLFTKYLSLRAGIDELKYKFRDAGNDGIAVSHYVQYFKGVKVAHGSYALTSKNQKVAFITGDLYTIPENTNIVPALNEAQGLEKVLAYKNASVYKWQLLEEEADLKNETGNPDATYFPKGDLVLIENFMDDGALTGKVFLAWHFDVYAHAPLSRTSMYVDAVTGKILLTDELIKHYKHNSSLNNNTPDEKLSSPLATGTAASRYSGTVSIPTSLVSGSYRLQAAVATEGYPLRTRNCHTLTTYGTATEFTDADNNWTAAEFSSNYDNVALDAHWGAAKVYDFWKTRHARNSYDNANAVINSYVHLDVGYDNAFWDGIRMSYGDGSNITGGFSPLTALDVCGHEIGHAVCSYLVGAGAGLTYNRESGALNEGLSDIWGASIERYADAHESDAIAKSYFDIGEEIGLPYPTPLRSMSNPNLYFQPDTYNGTNWYPATVAACPSPNSNTNDNCGVHTNSGVLNYWYYLLVTGGSGTNDVGNTFTVGGLDWLKAENIVYLAEQNLATTADYNAMRTATINAATTLYGSCSVELENVTRAWYAVNVGSNFVACNPQIGFKNIKASVTETSGGFTCVGSKVLTIPMAVMGGTAPTGGNAVVTVTATGTATSGQDYTLGTATATFNSGSLTDQNITLNILDDGNVEGTETITLDFTIAQNGSNAVKSGAFYQEVISITDDELVPETGSRTIAPAYIGVYNSNQANGGPFRSSAASGRTQYLWTAAELSAVGLVANSPIKSMTFHVYDKFSAIPFSNFNVSMGNTAASSVSPYITGLTNVFSGSYSTVYDQNTINFPTGFTWTGGNLVMEICFTNASAGTGDDRLACYALSSGTLTTFSTGTATGCGLAIQSGFALRPLMAFTQLLVPQAVEATAASNRIQPVPVGSNTYFYSSADNQLIAAVTNNDKDLGCTTATVTNAGTTFSALTGAPGTTRSAKEISIVPTTNVSTTIYKGIFYYTTAELAGKTPSSLYLVKTNAATDAAITTGNTVLVKPTVIVGTTYTGFSKTLTGFSRFFLVDNAFIVVAKKEINAEAYLQKGHAVVKWTTASETNSDHFVIERSYNGIDFKDIQTANASGNSITEKQYSVTDADQALAINYYRVRLINQNGTLLYSNIVSVRNSGSEGGITIIPNPVRDRFAIQYTGRSKGTITIMDATGKMVRQIATKNAAGNISLDASGFAPGVYVVLFRDENNNVITEKFIKE